MSLTTIVLIVVLLIVFFRVLYLEHQVAYWKEEAARQEMWKKEVQAERRTLELQLGTIKTLMEQI